MGIRNYNDAGVLVGIFRNLFVTEAVVIMIKKLDLYRDDGLMITKSKSGRANDKHCKILESSFNEYEYS